MRQVTASVACQLAGGRDLAAPTARSIATFARWCASTFQWSLATATGRNRAATALAGAKALQRFDRRQRPGKARSTKRYGKRWSIFSAVPAPAGEMDVVLGSGWPGVMLHEAVGHGLEGDFNRKKTSAFAGLMGQQVAAKGVTVVDDGTMPGAPRFAVDRRRRHAHQPHRADRGRHSGRLYAGPAECAADGHEARPAMAGANRYAHVPMPRMTNTYMLAGDHDPGEIIASVKNGLYAVNFGGGQVDITSGKYVFQCTEAYRIENGKVGAPVKGAMLIGNGPTDLHRISMIGNDFALDPGIGTCGKNGQGVPVGVGQPTSAHGQNHGGRHRVI